MSPAICLAVIALSNAAPTADAGYDAPESSLFVEGLVGGFIQREGAIADLRLRYRRPLYSSDSAAFKDNYVGVGLLTQTSPIFSQNGAYLEVAPASFFRLTAGYELVSYFGILDSLRPLSECDSVATLGPHDARCGFAPRVGVEPGTAKADSGHRVWVEGLAQARLGRFIAYDAFTAEHWWFRKDWALGLGQQHWFNEFFAIPQTRDDTVLTNSAAVLFRAFGQEGEGPQFLAGAAGDFAYSLGTQYLSQRVGFIGVYRVPKWKGLRELAAVVLVQPYTHDRYSRGAVPFMGLVLSAATKNFLGPERTRE